MLPAAFGWVLISGTTAIFGALRCVITSVTPGAASVAAASIWLMRPLTTLLNATDA